MKQNITVKVTQEDIDRAVRKDSSRCVVARAIARTIPDATRIGVDVQSVRFTSEGERRVFLVPPVVAGYVVSFDAGDELVPFSFRLRGDQEVVTRRPVMTEAGKAKARARSAANAAKKAAAEAETAAMTEEERAVVVAKAEAAKAAKAAVDAAHAGEASHEPADRTRRQQIPTVFKSHRREYGQRLLRINGGRSAGVSGS